MGPMRCVPASWQDEWNQTDPNCPRRPALALSRVRQMHTHTVHDRGSQLVTDFKVSKLRPRPCSSSKQLCDLGQSLSMISKRQSWWLFQCSVGFWEWSLSILEAELGISRWLLHLLFSHQQSGNHHPLFVGKSNLIGELQHPPKFLFI